MFEDAVKEWKEDLSKKCLAQETYARLDYAAPNRRDFYAHNISGAHALPNGNILICSGPDGRLFEVTPEKEIVWEDILPSLGGTPGAPNRPVGRRAMGTAIFRVTRYAKDYPAFKGRHLQPRESLE